MWHSVIEQRIGGNKSVIRMMVETYVQEGTPLFPKPVKDLQYGVSITDLF